MPEFTDPAVELFHFLGKLSHNSNEPTWNFLAGQFSVSTQSDEFYEIISNVRRRGAKILQEIIRADIADEVKSLYRDFVNVPMIAFSPENFHTPWSHNHNSYVNNTSVRNLLAISPIFAGNRQLVKYSSEELAEISDMIDAIINHVENEINGDEFMNRCIVEHLRSVKFRIDNFQWFGWDCTAKEIERLVAKFALFKAGLSQDLPNAGAMINFLGDAIGGLLDKLNVYKERKDIVLLALGFVVGQRDSSCNYVLQLPNFF
jgi:hypothetical protein